MQLPFSNLPNSEFKAVIGYWHVEISNTNADLFDILPNPDKFDERDSDFMLSSPNSKYYSIHELNSLNNSTYQEQSLALFHFHICSLPRNLSLLEDFIFTVVIKPDILAISEPKLNSKTVINFDIPQSHFFILIHNLPLVAQVSI